ncbi:hypothetical protein AB3480_35850 [Rhizobium mongolense]|uniref:hypothetical protein n=1 Tax=Rhizobium mongolense TaxID=57676 RepID=UPI0034A40997
MSRTNFTRSYEAKGLVCESPGPRNGAGWALTEKGTALIAAAAARPQTNEVNPTGFAGGFKP